MSFFDIRYLKSSNAVLVSRPKKYFETKYPTPFSPVNLESVTAQMPLFLGKVSKHEVLSQSRL